MSDLLWILPLTALLAISIYNAGKDRGKEKYEKDIEKLHHQLAKKEYIPVREYVTCPECKDPVKIQDHILTESHSLLHPEGVTRIHTCGCGVTFETIYTTEVLDKQEA